MIDWNPSFSTGVASIDDQHKKLFEFVNELERLTEANAPTERAVAKIVVFLDAYTRFHFFHEELCMSHYKCGVATENKQAHQRFLEELSRFKEELSAEEAPRQRVLEAMHRMVEDWLVSHIQKTDMHLKRCNPTT